MEMPYYLLTLCDINTFNLPLYANGVKCSDGKRPNIADLFMVTSVYICVNLVKNNQIETALKFINRQFIEELKPYLIR